MPRLALVLCLVWVVSLFVLRTAIHWKRTGSTGLKGFHGRPGSVPWLAGVAIALSFVLTIAAPCLALLAWPGGRLLFHDGPVHVLGAVLFAAGNVGALFAQLSMGDSWRIGVDATERTRLVTTGIFGRVRNPIFTFMWLSLVGLVLLTPNAAAMLAGALAVVGIQVHVRTVEEPYLAQTHGAEYRRYAGRVGRFVPGIGRLGAGGGQGGMRGIDG